ncbi:MAG: 3-isopropylmalate/(R)-2-methylmalate dehydratase small subunit [Myxococcota bacterium]|jgi:3-isopropylmalate/(R)-2-methylmalate dehydratase small subunit
MSLPDHIEGPALVLGDNVNTDVLHPSKFYSLDDKKVRRGFMGAVDGREIQGQTDLSGRIIVGGQNFGIGSSRETGARVFLLAGIQAVVAASFARIYHRNVLNLGLVAVTCPALCHTRPAEDQIVRLNLAEGRLEFGETSLATEALDPHWRQVLEAGGLMPFLGLDQGPKAS